MPKFGADIDLMQNHLLRARLESVSDPDDKGPGRVWFDPILGRLVFGNAAGDGAIDPTAREHHTGTQLAATISDLHTAVRANNRLDQLQKPTSAVDFNSQKLTGLAGIDFTDQVNLDLTQAATAGDLQTVARTSKYKSTARVVATSPVDLANPPTSLSGVTIDPDDGILLVAQTDSLNGLYRAQVGGGAVDTGADLKARGTVYLNVADESPSFPTPVIGDVFTLGDFTSVGDPLPAYDYTVVSVSPGNNGPHSWSVVVEAPAVGAQYERKVTYGVPAVWVGHEDVVFSTGAVDVMGVFMRDANATGLIEFTLTDAYEFAPYDTSLDLVGQTLNPYTNDNTRNYQVTQVVEALATGYQNEVHYVLRLSGYQKGAAYELPSNTETPVVVNPTLAALFYDPQNPTVNVYNDDGVNGIKTPLSVSAGGWVRSTEIAEGELVHVLLDGTLWHFKNDSGQGEWSQIASGLQSINALSAPTAPVSFGNQRITNVGNFAGVMTDAANYAMVFNLYGGGQLKTSVDVVITEPVAIDGSAGTSFQGLSLNNKLVLLAPTGDGPSGVYQVKNGQPWPSLTQLNAGFVAPNPSEAVAVLKGEYANQVWQLNFDGVWRPINQPLFDALEKKILFKDAVDVLVDAPLAIDSPVSPRIEEGTAIGWRAWLVAMYGIDDNALPANPRALFLNQTQQNSPVRGNGVYTLVTNNNDPLDAYWVKDQGRIYSGTTVFIKQGAEAGSTWRMVSEKAFVNEAPDWDGPWVRASTPNSMYETADAAATENTAVDGSVQVVDGVTVAGNLPLGSLRGKIVLLTHQDQPEENGLWFAAAGQLDVDGTTWLSTPWVRYGTKRSFGMQVYVLGGTANKGTTWQLNAHPDNDAGAVFVEDGEPQLWGTPTTLLTQNLSAGGHKITDLAYGENPTDAVNLEQLTSLANDFGETINRQGAALSAMTGAHIPRESVVAVATTNVELNDVAPVIDGVQVLGNQWVLLTAQTTASERGLWFVMPNTSFVESIRADAIDDQSENQGLAAYAIGTGLIHPTSNIFVRSRRLDAPPRNDVNGVLVSVLGGDTYGQTTWRQLDLGRITAPGNNPNNPGPIDQATAVWEMVGADRAHHTGTQLAATISNFDTAVRTSRLDQLAAPTADVSLNARKITALAAGTADTDAVNVLQMTTAIEAVQSGVTDALLSDFGAPDEALSMGDQRVTDVATPTADTDAANRLFVTDADSANLVTAKDYTDDTVATQSAADRGYTDSGLAANSTADRAFATAAIATQSTADRGYTDSGLAANSTADRAFATSAVNAKSAADRIITDAALAANSTADQGHADTVAAAALASANGYTDTKDAATRAYAQGLDTAARGYTDTEISELSAALQARTLDQIPAPVANVALAGFRITGLGASQGPTDAVNRGELDNVKNRTDWKDSVKAKATGNLVLSGLQTVDTIDLLDGDRVLADLQTDATQRNIYVVRAGAWEIAPDAAVLTTEASVGVDQGATWKGTQWRVNTVGNIVVGTTPISWTQFGAAVTYTASGGVTKVGNDFRLDGNVPRKYAAAVGDGTATQIVINHALGTRDVTVSVYYDADGEEIECQVRRTSASVVTLGFAMPPALNELRCVVCG